MPTLKTVVKDNKDISSIYLRMLAQGIATIVGKTVEMVESAPYDRMYYF
jgi:hypothetical protein